MRRTVVALAVGASILLAGCAHQVAGTASTGSNVTSITVVGELLLAIDGSGAGLRDGDGCTGKNGFSDIHEGIEVTVYDGKNEVVGSSLLGFGTYSNRGCSFNLTVPLVPFGRKVYRVEVGSQGNRGKVTFQESEVHDGVLEADLIIRGN